MFALPSIVRNNLYTPVSHGLDQESNRSLRVPITAMFSLLWNHLRTLGSEVWEHTGCIAEVGIELKTLSTFLRTVRYGVVNRHAPCDRTRDCSDVVVFIRAPQSMVRKWLDMDMFRVFRLMHRSPILAPLPTTRLPEITEMRLALSNFCSNTNYRRSHCIFGPWIDA